MRITAAVIIIFSRVIFFRVVFSRVVLSGVVFAGVCLLAAGASRAAERHWQMGRWADIDVKRQLLDFGPGASGFGPPNAAPAMRAMAEVRVYVIETDDLRLELREVVPVGRRSIGAQIDARIGEEVTFALEKNSVYVRDADGTEHKLRVTKKTERQRS
jgi:hypothetical protein